MLRNPDANATVCQPVGDRCSIAAPKPALGISDLDILLLADDTPKVLSVCLCLILISPRYFFFSSFM